VAITDGYIISTGPGGTTEYDTRSCPHCGGHFVVVPGSGRLRNFCMLCHAPTCNAEKCYEHNVFMKRVELVEAGKLPLNAL
jgi:hypothetical protein